MWSAWEIMSLVGTYLAIVVILTAADYWVDSG
jgi:hypothetical protein